MEGKVEHKFDMKPHEKNMEEYGRLCRERTNKSMIKNRQIQVIHSCAIHFDGSVFFFSLSFSIQYLNGTISILALLFFDRLLIMTTECI